MEFSVKLQQVMSIGWLWLLLGLLLAGLAVLFFILFRHTENRQIPEPEKPKPEPPKPALWQIQRMYLQQIDALVSRRSSGRIDLRTAYLSLSGLARGFVRDATGRDVDKMTLSDLDSYASRYRVPDESSMGILKRLVGEYYEPEFAMESDADFYRSCEETRRMIQSWQ